MATVEQPFGTIENTQEFLSLLSDRMDEVLKEARRELSAAKFTRQHVQAWQMVLYTVMKLSSHITNCRRLMNDLDTLKDILNENGTSSNMGISIRTGM